MPEVTLEAVVERLAALERRVAALTAAAPAGVIPATRDWRTVIGISEESDFSRSMQAEMDAAREAERKAAREGGEWPSSTPTT